MSKFDKIYAKAPIWLQNTLVSTYGLYWHWLRFGGSYQSHLRDYKSREHFSSKDWQAYQQTQLKDLLSICMKSVPYYRDTWSESEKQAAREGYLKALPLLEKGPLREGPQRFCRDDQHPLFKLTHHTSGTTGTPIQSIWRISEYRNALALRESRSANWAGVSFSQPRATFSGRLVEPDPDRFKAVYRYNAVEKQVYFSAFHLKPEAAHQYVDALWKHKTKWLTGYAVSYFLLAKMILDQNLKVPELKAVITTSEKLTPSMRVVMQEAYGCPIYEEYSTVENALFASDCEKGRLHVSPDVSMVEILRPDGTACEPGEVGEVVTTCLMRSYQPLIRFRLGDLAAWDPEPCPCGRQMPVIKEVVGRIEDVVIGPDGRQLVRFHGIFTDQPHVIEGQIIQESLDNVTVRIVPSEGFIDADILDIKSRINKRLGHQVHIDVQLVERIQRTKVGKFKAVISKLNKTETPDK
jgi:phenylacetate-CoA ligase